MTAIDPANTIFQKAVSFVNQTGKHLFLTGKAGTGKTTFLKYIREHSTKKMAVVAPTGVAAINAGGVTIHSFFQLPFGAYLPTQYNNLHEYDGTFNNTYSLLKNLRINNQRRDVFRELELLVIDEVSMVRADLLDMIDAVLRHYRRQPLQPFGGVQMLYIGDLYQLPPVVKNDDWTVLSNYYKSPFFFDAQVLQLAPPVFIELKKIYRQTDTTFINILNNIRNNECTVEDLQTLHRHYKPGYQPPEDEKYIMLTSHNARADTINNADLDKLPGKAHVFEATITGDFPEKLYPLERTLVLKEGAQVMFVKNDTGEQRRYYNGKLATIKSITPEAVTVTFAGVEDELGLEKEKWTNIRYNYDTGADELDEEEIGSFVQYPVRLAWAITIHKSQGLTFEKAIVDAGASFAPGQVYVALSRLTSLEGLVLYSRINEGCITTDQRVVDFVKMEMSEDQLQQTLEKEQRQYIAQTLTKAFDWTDLRYVFTRHHSSYETRTIPNKAAATAWAANLLQTIQTLAQVARNFVASIEKMQQIAEADGYATCLLHNSHRT